MFYKESEKADCRWGYIGYDIEKIIETIEEDIEKVVEGVEHLLATPHICEPNCGCGKKTNG
jgi:hypothetical protein